MRHRYRRHWRYRLQALEPGNRWVRRSRQLMSTTWLPRSEESQCGSVFLSAVLLGMSRGPTENVRHHQPVR
jgi:hypothetical protein